ncbi:magnesium transporter CorA family protein [Sphingopyxis sp. MWB1]|uniref:magnesium transporter CorA family protein n=1 Tax=Sphingopyxis sp. MWB1 TaxID=1537715 RepID=UPI00051A10E0|nr:magnesium transporter CorA family protein [Sphingopyxis sp. MWB1]
MLTAFARQNGHLVRVDAAQLDQPASGSDILWADIVHPDSDDAERAATLFGLSIPTLQEMEEIEPSARLYEEDGARVMTVPIVVGLNSDAPRLAPVTFLLTPQHLLTVRHAQSISFDQVIARRTRDEDRPGPETLMFDLLEAIVDRVADTLERTAGHCDILSRQVFARKNPAGDDVSAASRDLEAVLSEIGRDGDLLMRLRESLVGLERMLSYHSARNAGVKREAVGRLKTIQRDVRALTDQAGFLSSNINFLLDATLGLINLQQNQIIKLFTVAAVAFMPPTLVASIYGMNFEVMPELSWTYGYPLAVGAMVVSAVLPLAYFRKRGWL